MVYVSSDLLTGRRWRRNLLIVMLIVAAIGGQAAWFVDRAKPMSVAAAPAPLPPRAAPSVNAAVTEAADFPIYANGIGRVRPTETVLVKSRVDGGLIRTFFTEGDEVKAGDPLFQVDPRPYKAIVAEAAGQLAKDEAQLASAKADLQRTGALARKGYASSQRYDTEIANVGQFAAAIKSDQARLEAARLDLEFTTIRAPIAGRVGKRLVDVGNVVLAADSTPLVQIVQVHPAAVVLTVPQEMLGELRKQQAVAPLTVEARSMDGRSLLAVGRLAFIGNEIDQQTGTIDLKAVFDNTDDALWAGQLVSARVVVRQRRDAIVVAATAIQPGLQGRFVYVVDKDSIVTPRPVQVGPTIDGKVVIESGLVAGEMVVMDKQDQLAPEMTVRVNAVGTPPGLVANETVKPPL